MPLGASVVGCIGSFREKAVGVDPKRLQPRPRFVKSQWPNQLRYRFKVVPTVNTTTLSDFLSLETQLQLASTAEAISAISRCSLKQTEHHYTVPNRSLEPPCRKSKPTLRIRQWNADGLSTKVQEQRDRLAAKSVNF